MLLNFFLTLRRYRVPISLRELLDLLALLRQGMSIFDVVAFYHVSRMSLVKDEKYYDRFDKAFADFFEGVSEELELFEDERSLDEIRKALVAVLPQLTSVEIDRVLEAYENSREAQEGDDGERGDDSGEPGDEGEDGEEGDEGEEGHGDDGEGGEGERGERGDKGDDGTEGEGRGEDGEKGEGESEDAEEGERRSLENESNRKAAKVWLMREFADLDPDVELGTRNMKMALRRLRRFTRSAAELELDLHDTIASTARQGGILDIKMIPERHNAVKVLLLLDIGGSMDEYIEECAQLFSAAHSEFKHLEFYYFHNFIYETLWRDNHRRDEDRVRMLEVLRTYGRDYKVILVGDALMGLPEITEVGGSVEHYNARAGQDWLTEVMDNFRKVAWLNPVAQREWHQQPSIRTTRQLLDDNMFHLSPAGIEEAMKFLAK